MRLRRMLTAAAGLALLPSALVVVTASAPQASAAVVQSYAIPSSGSITVVGHGNGHGHGMSQYGAYGASLSGLTYRQILAFYYPGTTLTTVSPLPTLRVKISGGQAKTCVQNKAGLSLVGQTYAIPPATEIHSLVIAPYDTAPYTGGLRLRAYASANCSGTVTAKYDFVTASKALDVKSSDGYVRLMLGGSYWTEYWGTLGAVRSGSGELTINKVDLDHYAQGVAPRESPQYWGPVAGSAQAVAARTYAEYERRHAGSGSLYDICDTSMCQVYGGKQHSGSGGTWSDYPAAVANDKGQVLTYKGAVAFTQYSASNGGRTSDGGQPYMIAKADPYDNAASGDPYLTTTRSVPVASLAADFGLKTVTAIDITGRDGGTTGYVTSSVVYGTNSAGTAVSQQVTGYTLQSVFGLNSTYFTLQSNVPPPANLTSYVSVVHRVLTGRSPTAAQSASEATALLKGRAALTYTRSIAGSDAALAQEVQRLYAGLRLSTPSASATAAKVTRIRQIGYLHFEINQFASSAYYRRTGGMPGKWVRAVFRASNVYGATPPAALVQRYVTMLRNGASRQTVLRKILTSDTVTAHIAAVSGREVLGRALTANEVKHWRADFANGGYAPAQLLATGLADGAMRGRYKLAK